MHEVQERVDVELAWVLAAELLPVGLLGIPAGSLIARLGAKRTMNLADGMRAPLMTAIPILHWTGTCRSRCC